MKKVYVNKLLVIFLLCVCSCLLLMLYACHAVEKKDKEETMHMRDKGKQNQKKEVQTISIPAEQPQIKPTEKPKTKKVVNEMQLFVQENGYYCGPAVMQTILYYYGINQNQTTLAQELHTSARTGTEYADLARVLNQYLFQMETPEVNAAGYHVQTIAQHEQSVESKTLWQQRLRKNIDEHYPSVLAINLHVLYPEYAFANHVIICTGYVLNEQSDEVAYYYILDPYYKVQDTTYGGLKKFTPDEIWTAIVENDEPAYVW